MTDEGKVKEASARIWKAEEELRKAIKEGNDHKILTEINDMGRNSLGQHCYVFQLKKLLFEK